LSLTQANTHTHTHTFSLTHRCVVVVVFVVVDVVVVDVVVASLSKEARRFSEVSFHPSFISPSTKHCVHFFFNRSASWPRKYPESHFSEKQRSEERGGGEGRKMCE